MSIQDRILAFVDRILDLFNIIKGYLSNAVAFFEKLKNAILELVSYMGERIEDITEEDLQVLEEEHFFI
ncbi:hypothetical protein ACYSNM_02035 [Myroides sp. LJL116]